MFQTLLISAQLAVSAAVPVADADVAHQVDHALVAQASNTAIAIGTPVNGTLAPGDRSLNSGEFADYYEFQGEAGDQLQISMRSPSFNTYLGITSVDTGAPFARANDDAAGHGSNSQLVLTLPATGTYRVQATSSTAGEQGDYTLSVAPYTGGGLGTSGQAQAVPSLSAGQPASGQLQQGDTTLNSGEYMDVFHYDGRAGERVTLSLTSGQFDTYLMLRGPGGTTEDNDDVQEGTYDSGIGATLPVDGTYRVIVTSYQAGETGAYTLNLASGGADPSVVQTIGTLNRDQPVSGSLANGAPASNSGQFYQDWNLTGRAGDRVDFVVESSDFDTTLELQMPNGGTQINDDMEPQNTNSRINAVLPIDGTYTIRVSTYAAGETGDYQLTARTAGMVAPNDTPAQNNNVAEGDTLSFGGQTSGRLARRDTQLDSGEFYDEFTFQGTAGQGLTITMESNQIDTYVMLRGPGDTSYDNDDGPGIGTNSQIEASLPVTGTYRVLATSYAPGEQGRYTITLEEGTSVQNNATGEVYAILAGITDYADAGDLPFCAEDATLLGDSLQATGTMADESIILTDEQVTAANLERAFHAVAQQAGPDDVFMFFYSGHGSHTDNRDELDGRDETLYLFDGHVTDDQVAGWFDSIDARVSIIALDSCFSGGFARDVISAPNRMGIFSSEEDVTSNVAARFQAGGYLSYFLRNAIGGEADTEPRDGIITAGELSQYLHRQWAQNNMVNESTETTDSALAYQNLVIDRGSVKVTDVVVYNR